MGQDGGEALNTLADVGVQFATAGLVGVDKDGKAKKGITSYSLDEGIGEVTGRNAARKAIMEAKDAVNKEAADRAKQAEDEARRKQLQDIQASTSAGALRESQVQTDQNQLGANILSQDFLGL